MRWVLCLMMVAVLGFAPAPVYKPNASEKDLGLLQGRWDLVSQRGPDSIDKPTKPEGKYLIVQGSVLELYQGDHSFRRCRLEIDATKKERSVELREMVGADLAEKSYRGLYRIAGDELILCLGSIPGQAATSLEGGKGMERYTFRRVPKP